MSGADNPRCAAAPARRATDLSWPVDGPDPVTALRNLPGAYPHIDILEVRLLDLIPPVLEAGCPTCGVEDCDCRDWAARDRLIAAITARFTEYGYTEGAGLARLAAEVIQDMETTV
ncbi:hypothetical protein SAMN05216207_10809 [Pseudonocardia ammonioxydans]|uniref:Uncharacterized protein n=1 Tax=Pseudonocardia ammonioxydans TaxID=260086 RepID=A0A1I5HYR5_PSUAM|nr:hypothetical protein [Pseudonocardia ammonioxydans]SFO53462.1 hypothetical protein SAMN05216207_10809 [Pseudonocardia ammonioxydans]